MGEIRSTLDIIMEKAKDVEVTDEDKTTFMRREVAGKIRGLLQKYLDGFVDIERLQEEMDAFDADRYEMAVAALCRECLDRLTLEGDNQGLLDILSRVGGMDTTPAEELLLRHDQDLKAKRVARDAALRELFMDRGVFGSAAVPNLKTDPTWMGDSAEARDRFHREVAGLYKDA